MSRFRLANLAACLLAVLTLPGPAAAEDASDRKASLEQALAAGDRSVVDRARDVGRKPAAVVAFLGIEPGDTVIDAIAAGGWYTEVLSIAVGPEGTVIAQNPEAVLRFREGANDKALSARLAGGRLANVKRHDGELADLPIEPASADALITALNFHDVHDRGGREAALAFLETAHGWLEPGGVMGLVDHAGVADADNAKLHRIEESVVLELVEASPFELEATSDVLRNPDDDHTKQVFDPEIRGKTDRFVLRLRKAE